MNTRKKIFFGIVTVVIIAAAAILFAVNRPYQPVSFVADGDGYSASVENGSTLILTLDNADGSRTWSVVSSPACAASDFDTVTEAGAEFHILALDDGDGVMIFQCAAADGSTGEYQLALSISRHKKTALQIDSVSFLRIDE